MCNFFSLTSDGYGNIRYFDWEQRKRILSGKLDYDADSHTSINDFFGYKGALEDCRNKYEYNPLTGVFKVDAIHGKDDSEEVERKVRALDFSKIVPQLVIKPVKNPLLEERERPEPGEKEIELLEKWISVWDETWSLARFSDEECGVWIPTCSIWDSILSSAGSSVFNFVISSIWRKVKGSIAESVMDSIGYVGWTLVRTSFGTDIRYAVCDLAKISVWSFMVVYSSSFFELDEWRFRGKKFRTNPLQPAIDLWEAGLVPTFDGKVWRLHAGKNAQIVYEI